MNLRPCVYSVLASVFLLPMHAMGEPEAQEEKQIRRMSESGIFCGTHARALDEVDLQLGLLESGRPQEFRQKNNLKLSSCSLPLLFMMKEMGDSEAANYIAALEKETNIEIIYVIYRRYYNLADKINDRQFHNKGIDHKYMPRKLQRYWSEVFRQNIELNINLDIELELSDSEKKSRAIVE